MTEEILEGDKLIIDFLDVPLERNGRAYYIHKGYYGLSDLLFHSSWDWLMPVWVRFKNLYFEDINLKHYHKQICASFGNSILIGDIKNACSDAIAAIKWYNKNKQS